jgi:hypothetical protein
MWEKSQPWMRVIFCRFYFTAPRGNCKLISYSLFLPAEQKRAASPEAA